MGQHCRGSAGPGDPLTMLLNNQEISVQIPQGIAPGQIFTLMVTTTWPRSRLNFLAEGLLKGSHMVEEKFALFENKVTMVIYGECTPAPH